MKKLKLIALMAALSLPAGAARAQDSALLDLLVKKKVISTQEAEQTKAELAQEYAATPAGKLSLSTPVKQIRLYGDARVRYEYREGNAYLTNTAGASDTANADRLRYRLRLGADVTLTDDWFLGVRLETSNNARSTNVTVSNTGTGIPPFGKANTASGTVVSGVTTTKNAAGVVTNVATTTTSAVTKVDFGNAIFVGQLYLKYKMFPFLTVEAGKIPNPFVTTSMVWDPDINPEGFAEQFKYTFGPFGGGATAGYDKDGKSSKQVITANDPSGMTIDVFANLGEFVYDTASPQNQFGTSAAGRNDTWLFGIQLGTRMNFSKSMYLQIAPTFYTYSGRKNDFATRYSGDPGGNQTGINNLQVVEIPIEFGWKMFNTPFTLFADIADNTDSSARAANANAALAGAGLKNFNGTPFAAHPGKDNGIAWQAGLRVNQLKKKGDWTAAAYYQYSGAYSLDPNLIDDDVFDAHLNMQGFVVQAGYALTDAVSFNVMYNRGEIIDKALGTGGAGGTLVNSAATPVLRNYNLLQVDCNVKF